MSQDDSRSAFVTGLITGMFIAAVIILPPMLIIVARCGG